MRGDDLSSTRVEAAQYGLQLRERGRAHEVGPADDQHVGELDNQGGTLNDGGVFDDNPCDDPLWAHAIRTWAVDFLRDNPLAQLYQGVGKPGIAALAREYEVSMRKYLCTWIGAHLTEDRLGPAMDLFMGEHAPHEWPTLRPEVEA